MITGKLKMEEGKITLELWRHNEEASLQLDSIENDVWYEFWNKAIERGLDFNCNEGEDGRIELKIQEKEVKKK